MRLAALLVLFVPSLALAAPGTVEDPYLSSCAVTKVVKPDEQLPARSSYVPSNKPALPAGKSIFAPGQTVYLSGRVMDQDCVPIADAIVEIWQADSEGKYRKTSLGERLNPYPTFVSTARAVTDNLGRYNFVTVFPGGTASEEAPHLHVRVLRKNFRELTTEMYFGDDRRNLLGDSRLSKMKPEDRKTVIAKVWLRDQANPEKGLNARWNITLKGKNRYRHY